MLINKHEMSLFFCLKDDLPFEKWQIHLKREDIRNKNNLHSNCETVISNINFVLF